MYTAPARWGFPRAGQYRRCFANIYGHALDALFEKEAGHLGKVVRYADDLVILCRTESDTQLAYQWLERRAHGLHLKLHPGKTRIVNLAGGEEGFDFWGFTYEW